MNQLNELAKQIADATQDIKAKVEDIQTTTSATTVTEIEEISGVIRNVDEIVSSIATSVEQQAATPQEIAENVAQASQGISEVNQNVAQSSAVAADIAQVSHISGEINDSSNRVSGDAGNLNSASGRIKEMLQRFKIDDSLTSAAQSALSESDVPDLIRWDASIQLDIRVVDTQHRRLVDLINKLNRVMKLRKSRQALTDVFAELID